MAGFKLLIFFSFLVLLIPNDPQITQHNPLRINRLSLNHLGVFI